MLSLPDGLLRLRFLGGGDGGAWEERRPVGGDADRFLQLDVVLRPVIVFERVAHAVGLLALRRGASAFLLLLFDGRVELHVADLEGLLRVVGKFAADLIAEFQVVLALGAALVEREGDILADLTALRPIDRTGEGQELRELGLAAGGAGGELGDEAVGKLGLQPVAFVGLGERRGDGIPRQWAVEVGFGDGQDRVDGRDDDVGRHALQLDGRAAGRVPLLDGDLHRGLQVLVEAAQLDDVLDRALAVGGRISDDDRAAMVAHRAGEDLGGRGGELGGQHDERTVPGHLLVFVAVVFGAALAVTDLEDRAFRDEQARDIDRFGQQAAAVLPQVHDEGLHAEGLELVDQLLDVGGRAGAGAVGILAVERRQVDDAEQHRAVAAGHFEGAGRSHLADELDLVLPQYRGLLVTQDPVASSPGLGFLLGTIAHFGEGKWQAFWEALKGHVHIAPDWTTAYTVDFSGSSGNGKYPLVVSYGSSPPAEVLYADPSNPLTEPTTSVIESTCFRQTEYVGILRGTTNSVAAEALVMYLLGKRFQESMPLSLFVFPVNKEAVLPDLFVKFAVRAKNPLTVSPQDIELNREKWLNEWRALLL